RSVEADRPGRAPRPGVRRRAATTVVSWPKTATRFTVEAIASCRDASARLSNALDLEPIERAASLAAEAHRRRANRGPRFRLAASFDDGGVHVHRKPFSVRRGDLGEPGEPAGNGA